MSRWAGKHHVPHDAFQSTATCMCSSSSISRWARKHHVLHDAFWSTATFRGSSSSIKFRVLHCKTLKHHGLLERRSSTSRGRPESIMQDMMLSSPPRLLEKEWGVSRGGGASGGVQDPIQKYNYRPDLPCPSHAAI